MKRTVYLWLVIVGLPSLVQAQSVLAPKFDKTTMQFKGNASKQAAFLLRPVLKYGNVGKPLKQLPDFFEQIFHSKIPTLKKQQLHDYFVQKQIFASEVGGDWQQPLSHTSSGIQANYFVIHDASNFVKDTLFPANVNTKDWSGNTIAVYQHFKNAHVFVNRLGESLTCNDFGKAVVGTKFEKSSKNPLVGDVCVGNFLHIELIQPRIADKGKQNDAVAITPGFTNEQYQKLALLYLTASARKGAWLIPTFHAVLDEGIPDAHDDPQHFDLVYFAGEVRRLYDEITQH